MAVASAQMPNLASRAAPSAAASAAAQFFSDISTRNQRLAAAQQLALHRVFRAGHEHKGALAAIAIRRIVFAMQRHLAAAGDGGQVRLCRWPCRFQRARCRRGGFRGRLRGEGCAHRPRRRRGLRPAARARNRRRSARPTDASTRSDAAHAGSTALPRNAGSDHTRCSPSRLFLYARLSTALLPEIATQGETMEVNGIAHIFLTASNYERSRDFYRSCCRFSG